jgi:hypothetical protein
MVECNGEGGVCELMRDDTTDPILAYQHVLGAALRELRTRARLTQKQLGPATTPTSPRLRPDTPASAGPRSRPSYVRSMPPMNR